MGNPVNGFIERCAVNSRSRVELWTEFIRAAQVKRMVEVGVYQGDFAEAVLRSCDDISKYYMIDPWRHLPDWNKPWNVEDSTFEDVFELAKARTGFAADRRVILRGKTTEVIDQIEDGELDFAYIDGDHTLRGIAIDLIRVYPKVRVGGFVGGDDFRRRIWAQRTTFEPTLVCPFAVYFAEAVGETIYALPHTQFCLPKTERSEFKFVDLIGAYDDLTLCKQFSPERALKQWLSERFPGLSTIARKAKNVVS